METWLVIVAKLTLEELLKAGGTDTVEVLKKVDELVVTWKLEEAEGYPVGRDAIAVLVQKVVMFPEEGVAVMKTAVDEDVELSDVTAPSAELVPPGRLEVEDNTDSGEVLNSSVHVVSTLDAEGEGKETVELPIKEEVAFVDAVTTPRAVLVVPEAADVVENGRIEVKFATVGN